MVKKHITRPNDIIKDAILDSGRRNLLRRQVGRFTYGANFICTVGAHDLKMYTVYIIKSLDNEWYYVGFTTNLNQRIERHNRGRVKSTKAHRPFKLVFKKIVNTREEARKLEKHFKISSNKEKIVRNLK